MPEPELSYILVTDVYETIRPVVDRIRRQTAGDRVELVVVVGSHELAGPALRHAGELAGVCVVEHSPDALGPARAAGIRAATAPLVFVGETHSYPQPDLVEALVARAAEGWDVVVPAIGNANPISAPSRAGLLSDYGTWDEGMPAGEITAYPVYNAAFRREALLAFGDGLGAALGHDDTLRLAFQRAGRRAFFEPAAHLAHVNLARFGPFVRERFAGGMLIAHGRSRKWGLGKRFAYLAGSPLIPLVLFRRLLPGLDAAKRSGRGADAKTLALIALGLLLKAAGEAQVYAGLWNPKAAAAVHEYELHKLAYAALRES